MTLGEILLHKRTRETMDRLAKGEPVKMVAAQLASDVISQHFARVLGVDVQPAQATQTGPVVQVKAAPSDDNVIDAEFVEVKR